MESNNMTPYIIAEVGVNHEGNVELCKEMVYAAKDAGCNAIKLQSLDYYDTVRKDDLKQILELKKYGKISLGDLLKKVILSDEDTFEIANVCNNIGLDFISTPLGFRQIDVLSNIVNRFKIASMDLNNLLFIEKIAKQGKPVILSVGMSNIGEIETAINLIRKYNNNVAILYCVSLYPPKNSELNLNRITTLKNIFNLPVGFSDHTIGTTAAIIATLLGAEIIEKHFTDDKNKEGFDHAISADYSEMKILCRETRRAKKMLGNSSWNLVESEIKMGFKMRRSIVSKSKLKSGHVISLKDIDFKRPGTGIRPDEIKYILGRKLNKDINEDELIKWEDLI